MLDVEWENVFKVFESGIYIYIYIYIYISIQKKILL